jgi:hypothetical protein
MPQVGLEFITLLNKFLLSPASDSTSVMASGTTSVSGLLHQSPLGSTQLINSISNHMATSTAVDSNFTNFLQIEMLGQGLYTYGAL